MQHLALAAHKTRTDFDVDLVAARAAGLQLIEQFGKLRRAGNHRVTIFQPVAQNIGLARPAERAQRRNA